MNALNVRFQPAASLAALRGAAIATVQSRQHREHPTLMSKSRWPSQAPARC